MIVVNEAWTSVSHSRCTQPGVVCSVWRKSEQTKGANAIKVNGVVKFEGRVKEIKKKERKGGREKRKKEKNKEEAKGTR